MKSLALFFLSGKLGMFMALLGWCGTLGLLFFMFLIFGTPIIGMLIQKYYSLKLKHEAKILASGPKL